MRGLVLILAALSCPAFAGSPWGLELGLVGGMGISRFVSEPTPLPPPTNPGNLFAIFPPKAVGAQDSGLAGSAGASFTFTRKRVYYVTLEILTSGQTLKFDEVLTFPTGLSLKRSTVWDWSSLRPTGLLQYARPIKLGATWALAPRVGGGLWYEKVQTRQKLVSVDGATPKAFAWPEAPEDDWGGMVVLGMDWLRLGHGAGPARIGLDVRWREGHALPQAAVGADKPVRVIDAVLTVPMYLWAL